MTDEMELMKGFRADQAELGEATEARVRKRLEATMNGDLERAQRYRDTAITTTALTAGVMLILGFYLLFAIPKLVGDWAGNYSMWMIVMVWPAILLVFIVIFGGTARQAWHDYKEKNA